MTQDVGGFTRRSVAKKVRVCDLLKGKYVYGSREEFKPSFVITPYGEKVSRVNILGTVTDAYTSDDGTYSFVTVDDGSGAIRVKGFKEKAKTLGEFQRGDLVMVVGKVREFGGEVYVNCELAKRVENPNYETLRRLEVLERLLRQKRKVERLKEFAKTATLQQIKEFASRELGMDEEAVRVVLEERFEEDYKKKVLELVRTLDEGDGVSAERVFEICKLPPEVVERTMDELLEEGSLYECSPGRFKVVSGA